MQNLKGLLYACKRLALKGGIIVIAIIIWLCWVEYFPPLFIFAAYVFPAGALTIINKLIAPLELWISRITEYKQDEYGFHIGLGEHLRCALLKTITQQEPIAVSRWQVALRHTHPLTHHRIRRLDKLAES